VPSSPRGMRWKVGQLTGRSVTSTAPSQNTSITANGLSDHYAAISSDSSSTTHHRYASEPPQTIGTVQINRITKWRIVDVLDTLRSTSTGSRQDYRLVFKDRCTFSCRSAVRHVKLFTCIICCPAAEERAIYPSQSPVFLSSLLRPIYITAVLSRVGLSGAYRRQRLHLSFISITTYELSFHDQYAFQQLVLYCCDSRSVCARYPFPIAIILTVCFSLCLEFHQGIWQCASQGSVLNIYSILNLSDNI